MARSIHMAAALALLAAGAAIPEERAYEGRIRRAAPKPVSPALQKKRAKRKAQRKARKITRSAS